MDPQEYELYSKLSAAIKELNEKVEEVNSKLENLEADTHD